MRDPDLVQRVIAARSLMASLESGEASLADLSLPSKNEVGPLMALSDEDRVALFLCRRLRAVSPEHYERFIRIGVRTLMAVELVRNDGTVTVDLFGDEGERAPC